MSECKFLIHKNEYGMDLDIEEVTNLDANEIKVIVCAWIDLMEVGDTIKLTDE